MRCPRRVCVAAVDTGVEPIAKRVRAVGAPACIQLRREYSVVAVADRGGEQWGVDGALGLVADDAVLWAEAVHEIAQAFQCLKLLHRFQRELATPFHQHRYAADAKIA